MTSYRFDEAGEGGNVKEHWLGCIPCSIETGEPVEVDFVRLDRRRLVVRCPVCSRELRYPKPLGGSVMVDGREVPPFLGGGVGGR